MVRSAEADKGRLVLASSSRNRRDLLASAELEFSVQPADIDETVAPSETATALVARLARTKCVTVIEQCGHESPRPVIIAADTMVVLGETFFGKPADRIEAEGTLQKLSGQTHSVVTGVAVGFGTTVVAGVSEADVEVAHLSADEIDRYLDSGHWQGKAGSYGIQGVGSVLVERMVGSYSGVVGLPMRLTERLLSEIGFSFHDWRRS